MVNGDRARHAVGLDATEPSGGAATGFMLSTTCDLTALVCSSGASLLLMCRRDEPQLHRVIAGLRGGRRPRSAGRGGGARGRGDPVRPETAELLANPKGVNHRAGLWMAATGAAPVFEITKSARARQDRAASASTRCRTHAGPHERCSPRRGALRNRDGYGRDTIAFPRPRGHGLGATTSLNPAPMPNRRARSPMPVL